MRSSNTYTENISPLTNIERQKKTFMHVTGSFQVLPSINFSVPCKKVESSEEYKVKHRCET